MKLIFLALFIFLNKTVLSDSITFKRNKWFPDNISLHYAGSIGLVSAGAGYTALKNKIESDLLVGYVSFSNGESRFTITLRMLAKPIRIRLSDKLYTTAVYGGLYFNKTFGKEYWIFLPDKYPEDYYNFSPGLRTGIIGGTSLIFPFGKKTGELYFEASTYDLLLGSYWGNSSSIPFFYIVRLGAGIKIHFFR